jgi:hypothetical protein
MGKGKREKNAIGTSVIMSVSKVTLRQVVAEQCNVLHQMFRAQSLVSQQRACSYIHPTPLPPLALPLALLLYSTAKLNIN